MKLFPLPEIEDCCVAIIGMGYVGLPLAVAIGNKRKKSKNTLKINGKVICFDTNNTRIKELKSNFDKTNEVSNNELKNSDNLIFTNNKADLFLADVFIITVPTPIDISKRPDLSYLISATKTVGEILKTKNPNYSKNANTNIPIVIYESTVYPGATEEVCIPILEIESESKLFQNNDKFGFGCGYSPERINPGDKSHRLDSIIKVTSGNCATITSWIDSFYKTIIKAGTHRAKSIKVAEAAKVIENTQRDLNIALVNELAIIFSKLNIDTGDVLEAAGTKWNFLKFNPGLVGGHCIGVDPYYLTYKSQQLGYYPEVVLAGRRINDSMVNWIVEKLILNMAKKKIVIGNSKVLILGLTFKKNCPDIRNTQVAKVNNLLNEYNINTTIVDPYANIDDAKDKYDIKIQSKIPFKKSYAATIVAVGHDFFKNLSKEEWLEIKKFSEIIVDIDGIVPRFINPIRI